MTGICRKIRMHKNTDMGIKRDNRGLSLVELIIAVAIMAIVGIGIMGFVSFSSRNYTQANKNVKLQYEQQITVNRLRDIVMETSRGIGYDDATHTLTVLSDTVNSSLIPNDADSTAEPMIASRIVFTEPASEDEAGQLVLQTETYTADEAKGMSDVNSKLDGGTGSLLTDTVKDFDVDLSSVGKGKVIMHLTFKVGDKEIEVHPEVALRNMIEIVDDDTDIDELYDMEIIEFSSNVAKVEISRDGKLFGQARTDTINMAGTSVTVDYDAVVTKKSYYKGDIDTSVTWELDTSTLKEGYESYIILDTATGKLTLKTNADGTVGPTDYMTGSVFVLKAISNEDPTKIARLRIKVGTDGVYPKSITIAETHTQDLLSAQLVYTFTHSIEYTAPVTNSSGVKVNPLTGNDVYSKITYTVYGADKTTVADIPKSAGFSTTSTDGVFRIVKSMEEHTYWIKAAVIQKDQNGEEVAEWYQIYVEKGSVPGETKDITVPYLFTQDEYIRADYNAANVQWSNGVPTYNDGGVDKQYYYWYEWEIEPVSGWGSTDRTKFNDNAYLYFDGANKGTTYTSDSLHRIGLIYIEPRLDWSGTFTMRVKVRAKLAKTNSKTTEYYLNTTKETNIYANSSQKNRVVATISSGSIVNVVNEYNGQYYVNVNGTYGYIDKNTVNYRMYYNTKRSNVKLWKQWWGWVDKPNDPDVTISQIGKEIDITSNPGNPETDAAWVNYNGEQYCIKGNDYNRNEEYTANTDIKVYEASGDKNEVIGTVPSGTYLIYTGTDYWKTYTTTYNGKTGYVFYSDNPTKGQREKDVEYFYYKLPSSEDEMDDILTSNKDEAYVSSQLVTINPVKLSLTPVETTFYYNEQTAQGKLWAYFNTDTTIYLGKGLQVDSKSGESYKFYEYGGKTYKLDATVKEYDPSFGQSDRPYYYEYYKCYTPEFSGINVTISNYDEIIKGLKQDLTINSRSLASLQPYTYEVTGGETRIQPQDIDSSYFSSGIKRNVDNKLYVYVKIVPYYFRSKQPLPVGARWTCIVEGMDNGNSVIANSDNGEYYYFDYTFKNELDPTPTD